MNKIQQEMKLFHDKIEPILEKTFVVKVQFLATSFIFVARFKYI